jgi:hypothetical protein
MSSTISLRYFSLRSRILPIRNYKCRLILEITNLAEISPNQLTNAVARIFLTGTLPPFVSASEFTSDGDLSTRSIQKPISKSQAGSDIRVKRLLKQC